MITIALILTLFSLILKAPNERSLVIVKTEDVKPYEDLWNAVCQVESSGDPFAIGDRHLKHKSYGIAQVRKTRLSDYYLRTGIRYTECDMFDSVKAKEVFMWYCSGSDLEVISRRWNGGSRGMGKKSTIKYWNKVKRVLELTN